MDRQTSKYPCNRIFFSNWKEQTTKKKKKESQKHNTK